MSDNNVGRFQTICATCGGEHLLSRKYDHAFVAKGSAVPHTEACLANRAFRLPDDAYCTCKPKKASAPQGQAPQTAMQWLNNNWPQKYPLRQYHFIEDLAAMLEGYRASRTGGENDQS